MLALLVRLPMLSWGLPNSESYYGLHPDEPIVLAYSQQVDIARGKIDPGFYNYGTLYLTTLSIATKVVDGYSPMPERPTELDVVAQMRKHVLAGRIISCVAGASIAWIVAAIFLRWARRAGAAAAGLAIAFAPGMAVHSAFATVDIFAVFLLSLSLLGSVALWDQRKSDDFKRLLKISLWTGLSIGLSAGTKYTGILGLVVVVGVLILGMNVGRWKLALASTGATILGFIIGTPGAILHPAKFLEDFKYEMTHTSTGHGLVFEATPIGFAMHFNHLIETMGGLMVVFGLIGIGLLLIRREKWFLPVFIFGLLYYVLIGRAEVKFLRYVFPLVPIIALGFGFFVHSFHSSARKWPVALAMLAIAGFGGGSAARTLTYALWARADDPRVEAAKLLRKEGTDKTVGIVSDAWFYTPTLFTHVADPRAVPIAQRLQFMAEAKNPRVVQYLPEDPAQRLNWDIRLLEETRPDFVVLSSFEVNDVERIYEAKVTPDDPNAEWNRAAVFMKKLKEAYEIKSEFGLGGPMTHDLMYVRPQIWIWKRKPTSTLP